MPKKVKIKTKIILAYFIAIAIGCTVFYFIIPYLLNYGPNTINTEFDKEVSGGLYYYQQILITAICLILLVSFVLFILLKDIDKYRIYKQEEKKYKKQLDYIKKVCLNLPNRILLIFIIFPIILTVAVLFMQTSFLTSSDVKLMLVIFILSTTIISMTNIYIRKLLSKILIELQNTSFSNAKKTSIRQRLLYQTIPTIAVCIVFTYLAVSSMYERNNATLLSDFYNNQFENELGDVQISNKDELIASLDKITMNSSENVLFIADKDLNVIYQTGELSDFFKKYIKELSSYSNYKIYDYYGTSGQGTMSPITLENGQVYYIGAYYLIYPDDMLTYMIILLFVLGLVCSIILYTFAREFSNNVREVTDSLEEIAENDKKAISENNLYITSTDEFGELIKVYNNIQKLTISHLNQLHDNQETLMEKERLASLGQLIGGIAHNLKTPIMSISGAAEGLNDLIKEYDSSIDDPEVNSNDHHEIAHDMSAWVSKIKTHTEYMSDVITAVKGQAVALSNEENISFTIGELLKRVDILMKHELKNAIIYLNISMKTDENITISGDVNSLVQVINNMISNSIQAYNGKPEQNIDLIVEKENNNLIISIKDYASGMPKSVKDKLFKEMITTKGKNGTGLGLYMSYSTIRAHFNGNITVESEKNQGTTFKIILPI